MTKKGPTLICSDDTTRSITPRVARHLNLFMKASYIPVTRNVEKIALYPMGNKRNEC